MDFLAITTDIGWGLLVQSFSGNPFDSPGEVREGVGRRFKADTKGGAHGEWRNLQAMNRDEMGHDNELEGYRSTADKRDRGR